MKTYEKIYYSLLEKGDYLSGEDLASQLNLSRTSIWKGIQTLEKKGLVIDSARHLGYKLIEGDLLVPSQLSQDLDMPVFFHEESQSTQMDAKMGIDHNHPSPALYLAPHQQAAKGRYGKPFFASKTGGIYMSLHLAPHVALTAFKPYTILMAAAIVKTMQELTQLPVQIKWVNDIYLNGKKIAGVLTEAISSMEAQTVTDVIIGVGINFHLPGFPKELAGKAGNLFEENPKLTRQELIRGVWKNFFETSEDELMAIYKENSLVLGKQVSFVRQEKVYSGLAIRITDVGHLVVKLEDGQEKTLNSGEISLSSW
ncbi:biotin--protein ligase [Streptococcus varani]|uniref:Bifunctional ligase/repressor BirA n=1 Tax=Streptococcus varani TaxID=1608583 RepID=A0A0E4CTG5_9STRE|nr:bifunctional biotin--[acetyl-CoA-carboxylase] ligase/biotin operon repressor BirA [Streptococcus varani]CQR25690.1 biotin--protein ligase [Streptococcus varani]